MVGGTGGRLMVGGREGSPESVPPAPVVMGTNDDVIWRDTGLCVSTDIEGVWLAAVVVVWTNPGRDDASVAIETTIGDDITADV